MAVILVSVYLATGLCLVDALRRSAQEWAEADRNKSFWIAMLVLSGVFLLPALAIVPAYLVGVLPRFAGAAPSAPHPFAK